MIDLWRLNGEFYVDRPALGNEHSTLNLFKERPDHKATARVPVIAGRTSVQLIQVLDGLNEGDKVIRSDMLRYDSADRSRQKWGNQETGNKD